MVDDLLCSEFIVPNEIGDPVVVSGIPVQDVDEEASDLNHTTSRRCLPVEDSRAIHALGGNISTLDDLCGATGNDSKLVLLSWSTINNKHGLFVELLPGKDLC